MTLSETQILVLSRAAQRESGFLLPLPEECRVRGRAADKVIAGLIRRGLALAVKGRELERIPNGADPWRSEGGEPLYPVVTRAGLEAIGVVEPEDAGAEDQDEPEPAEPVAAAADMVDAAADATSEPAEPVEGGPARRPSRAAGISRRRLATARGALEAVRSHWADTGRLDEGLIGSCRATLAEIRRADAALEAEAPSVQAGEPRAGTKQARMIEMLRRPEGATITQIAESTGWQPHTVRGAIAGALKKKLGLTVTSEKPEQGERIYRLAGQA